MYVYMYIASCLSVYIYKYIYMDANSHRKTHTQT